MRLAAATSALGLGSSLPHLQRDRARHSSQRRNAYCCNGDASGRKVASCGATLHHATCCKSIPVAYITNARAIAPALWAPAMQCTCAAEHRAPPLSRSTSVAAMPQSRTSTGWPAAASPPIQRHCCSKNLRRSESTSANGSRRRRRACVQSRCRCGRGEPSPGADVAGVSPEQVSQGCASGLSSANHGS